MCSTLVHLSSINGLHISHIHLLKCNTINSWKEIMDFKHITKHISLTDMLRIILLFINIDEHKNKKAELSQRWPCDAPYTWVPWQFSRVPFVLFRKFLNKLLFQSIICMCTQNLKFVALPIPEIIGGTQNIWAVPPYAHTPFSPIF